MMYLHEAVKELTKAPKGSRITCVEFGEGGLYLQNRDDAGYARYPLRFRRFPHSCGWEWTPEVADLLVPVWFVRMPEGTKAIRSRHMTSSSVPVIHR